MKDACIFDAVRTPRDCREGQGAFYEVKPIDLLGVALKALRERNPLDPNQVEDLLLGAENVTEDYGVNLAKAALVRAGWPERVSGLTLNRNGASGLSAINLATMKVQAGIDELMIAGGLETRSRLAGSSQSSPPISDPEWLAAANYLPPGVAADLMATLHGIARAETDAYALSSHQRAQEALNAGYFQRSVIPVIDRNGLLLLDRDQPRWPAASAEDLAAFPPAYADIAAQGFGEIALQRYPLLERIEPVHTAGSTARLVDGAALVLIGNREIGAAMGLRPRARILSMSHSSSEVTLMFGGATAAAQKALQQAGLQARDIDLWECNEPFAAVALCFQRAFDIPTNQLNVNGGAIALGKAISASGAMLMSMLLDELERRDLSTGLVAIAAEGGMGVATVVERVG